MFLHIGMGSAVMQAIPPLGSSQYFSDSDSDMKISTYEKQLPSADAANKVQNVCICVVYHQD